MTRVAPKGRCFQVLGRPRSYRGARLQQIPQRGNRQLELTSRLNLESEISTDLTIIFMTPSRRRNTVVMRRALSCLVRFVVIPNKNRKALRFQAFPDPPDTSAFSSATLTPLGVAEEMTRSHPRSTHSD